MPSAIYRAFTSFPNINDKLKDVEKVAYVNKYGHKFSKADASREKNIKKIITHIYDSIPTAVAISSWNEDEWNPIENFINKIQGTTLAQDELDEKTYEELASFVSDFKKAIDAKPSNKPRPESFSDFVDKVLQIDDDRYPIKIDKNTMDAWADLLRSLVTIHVHSAGTDEYINTPEELYHTARKIEASRLINNVRPLSDLNLTSEHVKYLVNTFKTKKDIDFNWELFTQGKRMAEHMQDDTVVQRLRNDDKSKPQISLGFLGRDEMLDGEDIRSVLSLCPDKYLTNTISWESLPEPANEDNKVWFFDTLDLKYEGDTKEQIRERINLIRNYKKNHGFDGKIQVGFIVTQPEGHHVNVILTCEKNGDFSARVGDSLSSSGATGGQVVKYINDAFTELSIFPIEVKQEETFIGQIGQLCGDLALIDLWHQLLQHRQGITSFYEGVNFEEISKKFKNGEKDEAGHDIRVATYRAVAKAIAKDEDELDKLNEKIDQAIESQLRVQPPKKRPGSDALKPVGDSPVGDSPVGDSPVGDLPVGDSPVGDLEGSDDVITIEENKEDGSITLTGKVLTAKITEDTESHIPSLTLSFSDSKNEDAKNMSEADKEQKCEGEFNKILEKLFDTLSTSARSNEWERDGDKIVVDIVISGNMSKARQEQLKNMVTNSPHFTLGNVTHEDKKTPVGESKLGKALSDNSVIQNNGHGKDSSEQEAGDEKDSQLSLGAGAGGK
jgi:hypothetical protein